MLLSLISTLIVLVAGILLGVAAALRRGSRLDRAVVMFGVFGISSPAFVTGIFLLYVFGVVLGWFPTFGPGRGFVDRLWHLTLPAVALALSVMAIVVKITRAAMIEELDKDYVVFARARGMSPRRITFAYVLRNALIPVVTAAGIIVVGLLANAIYVEVTFALPGLGSLIVDAVQKRDIPLIQGTTLVFACFVVLVNLVVDVIYVADRSAHPLQQGGLVTAPTEPIRTERALSRRCRAGRRHRRHPDHGGCRDLRRSSAHGSRRIRRSPSGFSSATSRHRRSFSPAPTSSAATCSRASSTARGRRWSARS